MTIEHVPADPNNPNFSPARSVLTDDSIKPSTLTFTLGGLVRDGTGRYTTDFVRLWFEFSEGNVPLLKARPGLTYRRTGDKKSEGGQARGGNAVGIRYERRLLLRTLNVPRLPPTARLAESILGYQEGSIKQVYSITVMASP